MLYGVLLGFECLIVSTLLNPQVHKSLTKVNFMHKETV
jgi:hypothetical protein